MRRRRFPNFMLLLLSSKIRFNTSMSTGAYCGSTRSISRACCVGKLASGILLVCQLGRLSERLRLRAGCQMFFALCTHEGYISVKMTPPTRSKVGEEIAIIQMPQAAGVVCHYICGAGDVVVKQNIAMMMPLM